MLRGRAFLAIWHDVMAESEAEYNLWHTREHIPERVGIDGFEAGRRYVDWNLPKYRYFTLYESRDVDTFRSPAYLARLNAPTPWTTRVQPSFRNFVRGACETLVSSGRGIGGALATFQLAGSSNDAPLRMGASDIAASIMQLPGVTAVHIGLNRPDATSVRTKETELRGGSAEGLFDGLVMIEGIGRRELSALVTQAERAISGAVSSLTINQRAVYDLAFYLRSPH